MTSLSIARHRLSLLIFSSVAGCWVGGNAWAADGTITVNGTVKATTCSVTAQVGTTIPTSGSTPSLTITLPAISWQSIKSAGASAANTPFSIGVYGCGTTANTMAVNFETSNTNMNASGVITTTGTLVGNYLRLLNADQATPVVPGSPLATAAISTSGGNGGGAGQTFYVQYYNGTGATLSSSNAGTLSASLTYTINYT